MSNPGGGGTIYYFWMTSGGNISINRSTTSATERLDVNGRTRIRGEAANYPAFRVGEGTNVLSTNSSTDGSMIINGSNGDRAQLELISQNNTSRLLIQSINNSGNVITPSGGHLVTDTVAYEKSFYITNGVGTNNQGLLFGSGSSVNPDVGFTRLSSGVLKVSDGAAGHGTLNAGFFSGDGRLLTNLVHAKNLSFFTPLDNIPPAAGFATLDTRNSIPVLNFDAALNESGVFQGVIPTGSNLISGIRVLVEWIAPTSVTGNVVWGASFENANHDLDSDSFDIVTTGVSAANATAGIISTLSLNCTEIDSLSQGDSYRLKIVRSGGNASDTLIGDAQLLYLDILTIA